MCGRYIIRGVEELNDRFNVRDLVAVMQPRFNVAPSQWLPVVVGGTERRLVVMQWGLIPSWAREPKGFINARAETVAEKPAFRQAVRSRRCLAPADGFYEWQRTGRTKTPYFIGLRDGGLFAFAGIYDVWSGPVGELIESYAILTTVPNAVMAPIHDRMPVILRREAEETWLDPAAGLDELLPLLGPYPAGEMQAYAVSPRVNAPRNDDASLLQRA